jgi:hypothetical protein
MGNTSSILGTETVLLSLDHEHFAERLALRRAYKNGAVVNSDLVKQRRPSRIVDYSESFRDGSWEIAITVTAVSQVLAGDGSSISRPASIP